MPWPLEHLVTRDGNPVALMDAGRLEPGDALRWQLRGRSVFMTDHEFEPFLVRHALDVVDARDPEHAGLERWEDRRGNIARGKLMATLAWVHETAAADGWRDAGGGADATDAVRHPPGRGPRVTVSVRTTAEYPALLMVRLMTGDHLRLRWVMDDLTRRVAGMTAFPERKAFGSWLVRLPPSRFRDLLDVLNQGDSDVYVETGDGRRYLARAGAPAGDASWDDAWAVLPGHGTDTLSDMEVEAFWIDANLGGLDGLVRDRLEPYGAREGAAERYRRDSALFALVAHRLTGWRAVARTSGDGTEEFGVRDVHGRVWTPDTAGSYPLGGDTADGAWRETVTWRLPLADGAALTGERRRILAAEVAGLFGAWFTLSNVLGADSAATPKQVDYAVALGRWNGVPVPESLDRVTCSAFISAHARKRGDSARAAIKAAQAVSVHPREAALRPNHRKPWTGEAGKLLRSMWEGGTGIGAIAERLGRTEGAVATRIMETGLMTDEAQAIRQGISTRQISMFRMNHERR